LVSACKKREPVYDLLNCGPRNQFVVRGKDGPFIVHNCIQWLASYPIRHGIVRIRRELGLTVPLTVHDDVFLLTPDTLEGVELFNKAVAIMSEPLPWLLECPISVEAKLMDALDE